MRVSLPGLYCFILEGLFFWGEGSFLCQTEEKCWKVKEVLLPLENKEVDLFLCHKPPNPPQLDRWGGGSCFWQPSGKCPAGHHNLSSVLLRVKERGILVDVRGEWHIRNERGLICLPFKMLEGHSGIFTACSRVGPEMNNVEYSSLEAAQVGVLSKILETLKNIK